MTKDPKRGRNALGNADAAVVKSEKSPAIGYGKPPVKTQFKKGVSGNPKGRPKGARNIALAVRDVFTDQITIRQGDKTHRVSAIEALSRKQLEMGLKGNHRASQAAFNTAAKMGLLDMPADNAWDLTKLSTEELKVLLALSDKATSREER